MKAPDKIYIEQFPEGYFSDAWHNHDQSTGTIKAHEYIRKDALLKWAKGKNQRIDTDEGDYSLGYVSALIDLIDKIKSL